jgi:beta-lactam-binding protein with PASTA domain
MKLARAKARLKRRHCRVGKISRKHSLRANRGRVVRQIPKASKKRRPNGFKVKLTIGN